MRTSSNIKEKSKKIKLLGYVCIPIIFLLVGIAFLYAVLAPVGKTVWSTISFISPDVAVNFDDSIIDKYEGSSLQMGTIDNSEIEFPYLNEKYGRLECERLGIDASVYWGDNNNCLYSGVGTYSSSSLPGYGYPTLVSAHNTTYFRPLKDVEVGDVFKFTTNYGIYVYEVAETKIAKNTSFKWQQLAEENNQLIMYTCYPFEKMAGVKRDRLFVYCNKLSGPEIVNLYTD